MGYCLEENDNVKSTYLRHPPINHEIGAVDETGFVAGEEKHGVGLFDGFAEAAGGEMDFAAVAFGGVGAEEGLEEGCARERGVGG